MFTETDQWYFVFGQLNLADLQPQGCSPEQLLKTRWWEGPEWLKLPEKKWPQTDATPNEELGLHSNVTLANDPIANFMT